MRCQWFWSNFGQPVYWSSGLCSCVAGAFAGILYQVDSLSLPLWFGLVGIYPVPLSAGYSSVSSSCLNCRVWGVLSVFWQFVEFSLLWRFLIVCVGLYRWLVKVSWLGKLVLVFWWVELYFFSLECNEVSSNEL